MSTRPWLSSLRKAVVLVALAPLALATATADAQNPASSAADAGSAKPARRHRRHAAPPAPTLSGTPTEVSFASPSASASVELPPPPSKAASQKRKAMADLRQIVSSPGFQMLPSGGSRIETSVLGSPKVMQYVIPGALVYVFQNAMVPLHNNQNPLVTRFFNTPVADARLRQVGSDVHLVIDLRADAAPQASLIELVPGRVLALRVDFGPGSYWTEPATDPRRGQRGRQSGSRRTSSHAPPPATADRVLGPPAP